MGSSIFNFHVQSESAVTVSNQLTALMRADGYEPMEEQTGVSESWPFPDRVRSFYLFESWGGWVGVLDNDILMSDEIADQLAAALETYTISFHVNDSDSWHYFLTHRDQSLDEFISAGAGELDPFGVDLDDLNEMLGESGLEDFQMAIRELEGEFPPPAEEPPTNEAGLKIFSPSEPDDSGDESGDEIRSQKSADDQPEDGFDPDSQRHLTALKPLLVPGVSEQKVLEVLGASAVFAEETLAAFLPLIGINPYFAFVDFRDMAEDINPKELALESLHLHCRLDFEQQS